ncbi:MAG: hypothetical protein ACD_48C00375G0001 [uncultured bacterium]|nr:MAG: hypothetical protein ACD_48C00375G0001 [uncultured bacterium]
MSPILGTFGESFATNLTLLPAIFLLPLTAAAVDDAPIPRGSPISSTVLGHDKFNSIIVGFMGSNFSTIIIKSGMLVAKILTMTGTLLCFINSSTRGTALSIPGFRRPTELRKPCEYIVTRGRGFPSRGNAVIDFNVMPPIPCSAAR